MRLQQLECLCEIVVRNLSVSAAAEALGSSQPAVSRQLRALERELGIEIFVRRHKRFIGVTPPGRAIIAAAQRMTAEARNMAAIGRDFAAEETGTLTVATTHTQARYALPKVIRRFSARYPDVRLTLRQGDPTELIQLVLSRDADLCIGSEPPETHRDLACLPCYELQRIVLAPRRHPLLREKRLTLASIARYPIITYDHRFVGRTKLLQAFNAAGLMPNIVLSAIDTDVIKSYVESGIGIAIVARMAFDPSRDRNLRAIDASHLFASNTIYVSLRRHDYLRRYVYDFIEIYAPRWNRAAVESALGIAPRSLRHGARRGSRSEGGKAP